MSEEKKSIRIVDIAKMANVSSGTVDRVLHNRGKVSAEKKKRVESVLKEINYEPNILARSLSKKVNYTIVVFIPVFENGSYWDLLNRGILKAANELQTFNINVKYTYFDQYDSESFASKAASLHNKKFDAMLMAPLFEEPAKLLSQALDHRQIPYVYIDYNIQEQNNLAFFGANSFDSGILMAKLLFYEISKDSDIIIARFPSAQENSSTQDSRERGFIKFLKNNNYSGKIHNIKLLPDISKTQNSLEKLFHSNDNIKGAIMFNSKIYELASILFHKIGNTQVKSLKLVGYDLIEKNIDALINGEVSFLLSQRSDMQGYNGVKALSNYLLFQKKVNKTNYMPIDILVRENIDYYNNANL